MYHVYAVADNANIAGTYMTYVRYVCYVCILYVFYAGWLCDITKNKNAYINYAFICKWITGHFSKEREIWLI